MQESDALRECREGYMKDRAAERKQIAVRKEALKRIGMRYPGYPVGWRFMDALGLLDEIEKEVRSELRKQETQH